MTDLQEEFSKLRQLNPPAHLWARVQEVQEGGGGARDSSKRRALLTAAVALGFAAGGFVLAVVAFPQGLQRPTTRTPSPASDALGGPSVNGKLAFVSGQGGYAVDTVNPDGTERTDFTDPVGQDYDSSPQWAPDGSRLAFLRYTILGRQSPDYRLMVADAQGQTATMLTGDLSVADPVWSPRGTSIAFVVVGDDGSMDIFVVNADGTSLRRLTDNPGHDISPSWSPNGESIVYEAEVDGTYEIYGIAADGSRQVRLTNNPGYDGQPSWSPDGKKIAFLSERGGETDIYTMNPDGSGQTRIVDLADDRFGPLSWSPDGSTLAFQAFDPDSNWDVWIADAKGVAVARATDQPGDETGPVWSPDGAYLAYAASQQGGFTVEHSGTSDIYIMKSDGSSSSRIVANALASCCSLTWQPLVAGASD
jgi:TolB protein